MSGFEYLFTFASLLFGLAIANLANGYADIWRDRSKHAIGALTSLLGLVLTLSICRQWLSFWGARETLGTDAITIFAILLVAGPFVFLSQAMFPRQGDDWGSHDEYYLCHRGVLMGMLMMSPLFSLIYNLLNVPTPNLGFFIYYVVAVGIPAALIIPRLRWVHVVGLTALALHLLAVIFIRWG